MSTTETPETERPTIAERKQAAAEAEAAARPIRALAAGELACLSCGVAVPGPHAEVEHVEAHWRDHGDQLGVREIGRPGAGGHVTELTRCAACLAIHEQAGALLDEHPAVRYEIGSRSIGVHRVEAALGAVSALGDPSWTIRSDRDLRLLLTHLTGPGVAARFASRYAPVLAVGAHEGEAAAAPWAHLTAADREELRAAFGALMKARVERPRPYAPPKDADRPGCLYCGIGTVRALPSRQDEAWAPFSIEPRLIGGASGAARLWGYLCPVCTAGTDSAGAVGRTAMQAALSSHLGVRTTLGNVDTELRGLAGWGILPEGTAPNETPWGHIGNLDEVRRMLA